MDVTLTESVTTSATTDTFIPTTEEEVQALSDDQYRQKMQRRQQVQEQRLG
jgi:hypothetical protein